ncbi:MAG TPA: tRNA pseudouridine(55) synthase TruB [Candidatus Saccharimonadales bacterium]|nr:tRNA pseudouridine(55) synthase TruB [Candidatus Saccharimonadales bacterium]
MHGILLVDKPLGWTSFDVVNKVRRMVQTSPFNTSNKKRFPVGHTGTLDPMATGLLVLLLGTFTKQAPTLTKVDKTYEVVMRLGQASTTGDSEGEIINVSTAKPSRAEVEAALDVFKGEIMQTPPAFSAIKVNGQRAYKLAREGKTVTIEPRKAIIHRIDLTEYVYPDVRFTTEVSSGTYVRSLVEDIGKQLGTGAYMSGLRRTKVGAFDIADTVQMDGLTPEIIQAHLQEKSV